MKIAFVTARSIENEWREQHAAVSDSLIRYLKWCGYSPFIFHRHSTEMLDFALAGLFPDLVVLSGGESIGVDPTRDDFEILLLRACEERKIPVLGICRGMQMIGMYFSNISVKLEGHSGVRHAVAHHQLPDVNSFHNFGFPNITYPLIPLVKAFDSSIEAFRHAELPWIGVMWHPEREPESEWLNVLEIFE